ncbi:MAG: signal peptidase II [Erysipelotrichaceae bacterium]|nr:signal peptidase II [Erysipelotrichaceae bacterium]
MKKTEILLFAGIVALDLLTKTYIETHMTIGQSIAVIDGFFYITFVTNTGAAWSILSGNMDFLTLVSLAGMLILGYLYLKTDPGQRLERYAWVVLLAGTAGNFYDRLRFHYVRDFLDFYPLGYDFPVFNIADSALTIGVGLLLLTIFFERKKMHG